MQKPTLPVDSFAVANFFIQKGLDEGRPITHLVLQKLLYLAHGVSFIVFDEGLLDAYIEAWQYGPVVPHVYHEFKFSGNRNLLKLYTDFTTNHTPKISDNRIIDMLNTVWQKFGNLSSTHLVALTHLPGSPWGQTIESNGGIIKLRKGQDISDDLIKNHFIQVYAAKRVK